MKQASIAARLNRLPIIRTHRYAVFIAGLGTFFDIYDIFLAGVLGAVLTKQFNLSAVLLPTVIGSSFLGMFLGAATLGTLADRVGRRKAFMINLALYSLFTLVGAFSVNAGMLIAARFIAGIGLGAELPLIDAYLADLVAPRFRGRSVAYAYTLGFCGIPAAGFLARFLVPLQPLGMLGWRWLFVIGSLGAIIVWVLRRYLPESPRWLESVGRHEEADAIVTKMEQEVLLRYGRDGLPEPSDEQVKVEKKFPYRILFAKLYVKRTIMLWVFQVLQVVGYYGFGTLVPMVLVAKGISILHSLTYVSMAFVGYPIGSALSILVMERMDRKWLIVWSAFLMGVFGLALGFSVAPAAIVACGFLYTIVANIFSNGLHTLGAEIYPTYARATAASVAYSLSRLSSGLMPFVLLPILNKAGPEAMFAAIGLAMLLLIIDIAVFAPSTTGLAVEEISALDTEELTEYTAATAPQ